MSSPTYWSQPNQQVVRDGDPVGIISDEPDPQTEDEPNDDDDDEATSKSKRRRSS